MRPHDLDELSAYALGALSAEDAAVVETHLRECRSCRADLAELRQVTDALDELPPETFVQAPPEGDKALRRALQRMRAERRRR